MPMEQAGAAEHSAYDIFAGGGEMGARMRALDWSKTALGPVEQWPQSLKTTVSTCLNSRFAILIWWGKDLVKIYNDAYAVILGRKHPDALGCPGSRVWPEIWHIIGPMLQGVIERGEATWSNDLLLELEASGYPEERYFTFSYSPIRDESGGVGGVFTPVQETTVQVIGERRLRTLRELAEEARVANARSREEVCQAAARTLSRNGFDVPFAAFYLLSEDGQMARLAGAAGFTDASPLFPEIATLGKDSWLFEGATSTNKPEVLSLPATQGIPCGAWPVPPQQLLVLPIAPSGQRIGFVILAISPRKRLDDDYMAFLSLIAQHVNTAIAEAGALEEERKRALALAELDRAKTTFFSNVSHEFRTPLTLMLGPLEELQRDGTSLTPSQRNQLDIAQRNSLRLLRLVNTLLDFSRIEAGRIKAFYVPVDLAAFTAELASHFRSVMEAAGLNFVVKCQTLRESVYIDPEMWEKVVLNLLSNAFKFTLAGAVEISLEQIDQHAVLSVKDTGTGIRESELPHIFERFYRVEGAEGRTYEGTGIGLALIQELVKLHGGSVEATSRVGEGTTFKVVLPFGSGHLPQDRIGGPDAARIPTTKVRVDAFTTEAATWLGQDRLASPSEDVPAPKKDDVRRSRVLVADDNADMRAHLMHILGGEYEVAGVPDGVAALKAARETRPDVVLSDIMMPGLDGFGLLKELRADPELHEIPVILLSARAGEDARIEGIRAGADDYLTKPFSTNELLARIKTTLSLQRMRREERANVERALAQFETLLNQAPLGVYLVDSDFRIRNANPTAQAAFAGISDLIGRDFDEVVRIVWPKAYADEIVQRFRYTLETGKPYSTPEQIEERLDRGAKECYEWRIDRIPLPDGRFGVVCYFRDISAQVQAREAIRALNEELRFDLEAMKRMQQVSTRMVEADELDVLLGEIMDAAIEITRAQKGRIQLSQNGQLQTVQQRGLNVPDSFGQVTSTPLFGRSGAPLGILSTQYLTAQNPPERDLRMLDVLARQAADLIERKLNDEALRESEALYAALVRASSQIVWTATADGTADEDSPSWREFTGRTIQEWKTYGWLGVCHPDDVDRVRTTRQKALHSGTPVDIEFRVRHRSGEWRWMSARAVPLFDLQRRVRKWVGMASDISARRQAEERERAAVAKFESVFNQSGIFAGIMDVDGNLLECNDLSVVWCGYTREQVLHRPFWETPWWRGSEDTKTRIRAATMQTASGTAFRETMRYWVADGSERIVDFAMHPIRDESGAVRFLHPTGIDITERKQVEHALATQRALLEIVVGHLPACVCLIGGNDLRLRMVNPAYQAIAPGKEMIGRTLNDIWPETHQNFDAICQRVLETGEPHQVLDELNMIRRTPDGPLERVYFSWSMHRVRLPADDGWGLLNAAWETTARVKAESALRESEATLRGFYDNSPVCMGVTEPAERDVLHLYDNPASCRFFRIGPGATAGRWALSELGADPATVYTWIDRYRASEATGQPVHFEHMYATPDEMRWLSVTVCPIGKGPSGRTRFCYVAEDITESKQAEQALRESEQRFQVMADTAPAMLWITGPDGSSQFVSKSWLDYTGQTLDAARGAGWLNAIHPDDREASGRTFLEANAKRAPVSLEYRVYCAAAGEYRWAIGSGRPRYGPDGDFLGYIGAVFDVHERKQAEEALRESEERFRTLADNMSQFAWMTDARGWIVWYNQRWYDYTGTTLDEMKGWGWQKVHHPDHVTRVVEHIRNCFETGAPWEDTFPLRSRHGEYRWFLSRALPIRDRAGQIVRWFGTNTDITEQLEIQRELRRVNHDLEQFAYSSSHDLQEPLRNVAVYSQLLEKRYGGQLDQQAEQFLHHIVEGAQRMGSLVSDLLAYTRAGSEDDSPVDLTETEVVLEQVLASVSQRIKETGAVVTHDHLPDVYIRRSHLQQLLQNLVSNGLKYRKDTEVPRVHITAERLEASWRFSVIDNGIGIAPEFHQKVFGVFKRLHSGTQRYAGTGIGLAICQKIVERYGGRIWVESKLGNGSTFHFTLAHRGEDRPGSASSRG